MGHQGRSHAILAFLNELRLLLLVVKELLVSNVLLTICSRPTKQHTSIPKAFMQSNTIMGLEQYTRA